MVRAKYVGSTEGEIVAYGTVFHPGKFVDVNDAYLAKMLGNPFFAVEGAKNESTVGDEAEQAPEAPAPAPPAGPLTAVHRGRGQYQIVRGDDVLMVGLSKDDADTFNGLSDHEKDVYVSREGVA